MISVCIPLYNNVKGLVEILRSLETQTYQDFEVVISDDSDASLADSDLFREYSKKLKISYRHNVKKLGSPANWNQCIDMAGREWIKFIHHDDCLNSRDALENFFELTKGGQTFIFSATLNLDSRGNPLFMTVIQKSQVRALAKNAALLFNGNIVGAPSVTMFKKTPLRFDVRMKWVVDIDFYIHYLLGSDKGFAFTNIPLVKVTTGDTNQVTASCANPMVDVGEHLLLYEKLRGFPKDYLRYKHLFTLFERYNLSSEVRFSGLLGRPPAALEKALLESVGRTGRLYLKMLKLKKILDPFFWARSWIRLFGYGQLKK